MMTLAPISISMLETDNGTGTVQPGLTQFLQQMPEPLLYKIKSYRIMTIGYLSHENMKHCKPNASLII